MSALAGRLAGRAALAAGAAARCAFARGGALALVCGVDGGARGGAAAAALEHARGAGVVRGFAADAPAPVTKDEVLECQREWADAIKAISRAYLDGGDFVGVAGEAARLLYGYGRCDVLFKPTKAAEVAFRPDLAGAVSYFVGARNVEEGGVAEDGGFAINCGKGWRDVVFTNHRIDCAADTAVAMGSYAFTCAATGERSEAHYTFGYRRNDDGRVRIFLHHSSVPYSPAPARAPA